AEGPHEAARGGAVSCWPSPSHDPRGWRRRIDHVHDFSDLRAWKSAALCVLAEEAFALSEIDAKEPVAGDMAVNPLNARPHIAQARGARPRTVAQLLAEKAPDAR